MIELDHLVVGAPTLEIGQEWAADMLRSPPVGGGSHVGLGTHNALWSLGPSYLEVIAVDASMPAPKAPRAYGLDDPDIRAHLSKGPSLLTWVVRGVALDTAPAAFGSPRSMARGDLHWRLSVPENGSLPHGGALPALIEWPDGLARPDQSLKDAGLRLVALNIPADEQVASLLKKVGAEHLARYPAAEISAELALPDGASVKLSR